MPRLLLLVLCALALAGCGTEETDRLRDDVRDRAERIREDARELRADAEALRSRTERLSERVAARVRTVLDDLERAVPQAGPATEAPETRGNTESTTIDAFLTSVLESVDEYWTTTLTASGVEEPRVAYEWVAPGRRVRTRCGAVADDQAAFYCPADDTIYIAQVFAARLYRGLANDLPGSEYGRAVGDFGVAYIVAHEYAHNLQNEFGSFENAQSGSSKPFELQADCMAGLWGNSVYRAGKLQPGDIQEALDTALAVGDFDYTNRNHHGTPQERRAAWLAGFDRGDPASCRRFVSPGA